MSDSTFAVAHRLRHKTRTSDSQPTPTPSFVIDVDAGWMQDELSDDEITVPQEEDVADRSLSEVTDKVPEETSEQRERKWGDLGLQMLLDDPRRQPPRHP
jgi:hypothetical protein